MTFPKFHTETCPGEARVASGVFERTAKKAFFTIVGAGPCACPLGVVTGSRRRRAGTGACPYKLLFLSTAPSPGEARGEDGLVPAKPEEKGQFVLPALPVLTERVAKGYGQLLL